MNWEERREEEEAFNVLKSLVIFFLGKKYLNLPIQIDVMMTKESCSTPVHFARRDIPLTCRHRIMVSLPACLTLWKFMK